MHGTEEASNDGRVRVRIIHGLTLVIRNSYTYCKSFISPRSKVLLRMLLGEGLVGVNHRAIPTSTHKEGNQKSTPCNKFVTQLLPYVHATGLANFNTSISQFNNYPTSITLTLPPLYLKTIIKYQTSHSIQCTLYDSFYYTQLGCPSYWDQFYNQRKFPCCSKRHSK